MKKTEKQQPVKTDEEDLTPEEQQELEDKVHDRFELLQERYGGRGPQSYWEYQEYLNDFVYGAEDLDDCESIEDYVVEHGEEYDPELPTKVPLNFLPRASLERS